MTKVAGTKVDFAEVVRPPAEAYRRIVPVGYQELTLHLEGTSALLMSSGDADRDSELYRAYATLGKARKRSVEQEAQLRRMEWALRLYLDAEIGPYIPSANIHELLQSAASEWRLGEAVKRSLVVEQYRIPLEYDGPRKIEELWDAGFRDLRMVKNAGSSRGRVVRCRPKFENWSLTCQIAFDPEDHIDAEAVERIVERSQKYGLGDYRPQFGSFRATLGPLQDHAGSVKADGLKPIDSLDEQGHRARRERIKPSGKE